MSAMGLLPVLNGFPIVVDFEKAAISAIKAVLNADVYGCSKHFRSAIQRNVENRGLKYLQRTDGAVAQYIRRVKMLPFLPSAHQLHAQVLRRPRLVSVKRTVYLNLDLIMHSSF